MKMKIFTLAACIAMTSTMQGQNIVVNLSDGKQVTYPKEDISNIEFTPEEYTGKLYYATTDMTFAEFFAGELHQSAEALVADGMDAFTAATSRKSANFSACVVSDDNTQILGVKAVNVDMTEEVYNALSEEEKVRFTFMDDAEFSKFKTLKADGSFSPYNSTPKSIEGNEVLFFRTGCRLGYRQLDCQHGRRAGSRGNDEQRTEVSTDSLEQPLHQTQRGGFLREGLHRTSR